MKGRKGLMQQVSVERKATWEEKVRMLSIPKTVEERRCRLPYGLARGLTHVYSLVFELEGSRDQHSTMRVQFLLVNGGIVEVGETAHYMQNKTD